jgi:hypothetical protein
MISRKIRIGQVSEDKFPGLYSVTGGDDLVPLISSEICMSF